MGTASISLRLLLPGFLALFLLNCSKTSAASDVSDPKPAGFFNAWSQFLELDASAGSAGTPVRRPSRGANSVLTADLRDVTDKIRTLYSDAGSYIDGFPTAEESYHSVPRKFQESVDRVRENRSSADRDTIRRRLTQMTAQALEVLERLHTRFNTLNESFKERLGEATKRTPGLEQACAKVQANPSASPEEQQACSKFQDADSMIKTKADLVSSGFARLEDIYRETRQAQDQLNAQTLASVGAQ